MKETLVALVMLVGAAFSLLAAVGVLRFPDLFMRMQASAKSATLGVACTTLAAAIYFPDLGVKTQAVLVTVFLFLTAPVAAHMIARAAYYVGMPLWDRSVIDELRPRLESKTDSSRGDRPAG